MRPTSKLLTAALLLSLAPAVAAADCGLPLVDTAKPIQGLWTQHDFSGKAAFANGNLDGRPVITARSGGASGLYLPVERDVAATPVARWSWRVDRVQDKADLRRTETEDFSAAIFFVFGEPSLFRRHVPTLAYAITATPGEAGAIIPSPRHPKTRMTVKLRGPEAGGQWLAEERDILADYRRAFGRDPEERLRYVALFSDDDQTGQPVHAAYGAVTLSAKACAAAQ
ncbi:MAG TPA: DUF3047 domain-containing protein [Azospirillaceae bacterium]|nr:DUF3047 domain-containing protein [Azospirillaceae bacterium]